MCGSKDNSIRLLLIEELLHCVLVCKVKLLMATTNKVRITSLKEVVPNGRANKTMMASHEYFAIFV